MCGQWLRGHSGCVDTVAAMLIVVEFAADGQQVPLLDTPWSVEGFDASGVASTIVTSKVLVVCCKQLYGELCTCAYRCYRIGRILMPLCGVC